MKPTFVLDASSTLAWCLPDEKAPSQTEAALARLEAGESAIVPPNWHLEVVQGVLSSIRRKRINPGKADEILGLLSVLPIVVDEPIGARAFGDIRILCTTHGLSTYDAVYLDLAARTKLPLATQDGPLRLAAKKARVSLL